MHRAPDFITNQPVKSQVTFILTGHYIRYYLLVEYNGIAARKIITRNS